MKRDVIILLAAAALLSLSAYHSEKTLNYERASIGIHVEAETEADSEIDEADFETEVEAAAGAESVEDTEAGTEAQAGYVMYSSIWDKVQMSFYEDGTCVFKMPDYKVTENCTWTYIEGVLTVTREDGTAFSSYMAEDGKTLKLDYTAAANEQLVGQFDSTDYTAFFN